MNKFKLVSKFKPAGDQPKAIEGLLKSIESGNSYQTLLGVTGSGKTFTMANVIEKLQRPTLIISHNKTLAAQLASEFQEFFPDNAIHYFVSYYDYYQPEAYMPRSDTYIEKETQINEEIDRLRNSATQSLLTRKDVLIVASVSCIYGLGNPADYMDLSLTLQSGKNYKRDKLLRRLADLQYHRNDMDLKRGTYRAHGDVLEIILSSQDTIVHLDFFGDTLEKIEGRNALTNNKLKSMKSVQIFPAKHFVASEEKVKAAIDNIRLELHERLNELRKQGKVLEAARLEQRTNFDLEMLTNTGFVSGIENYSRHMDGRAPGEPPSTLIDYFPDDYLLFIDESHQTIPQIGAMYEGDRSRKNTLVEYGFRLPSALDNRPLKFDEWEKKIGQAVFVSATPAKFEIERSLTQQPKPYLSKSKQTILDKINESNSAVGAVIGREKNGKAIPSPTKALPHDSPVGVGFKPTLSTSHLPSAKKGTVTNRSLQTPTIVEQIIRPTGLLDPTIKIKPIKNQIDDLLEQIKARVQIHQRVLVATLTKRMAEELTEYLKEDGIKVQYLHSDVDTFERLEILRDLRLGVFDVLVGINLLREGLDLPEVSLVAILDADKEGFLRSETFFMQMMGRAARHVNGHVIMYADRVTGSMKAAIEETTRRRKIQEAYNSKHGITPQTIVKKISESRLAGSRVAEAIGLHSDDRIDVNKMDKQEFRYYMHELEEQMELSAKNLDFELAAKIRDRISEIKKLKKLGK